MYLFWQELHVSYLFISYVNDGRLIPEALSEFSDSPSTGKNHKQEDTAVLKGYLTALFDTFHIKTKEICSSFLFWR